MRMRNYFFALFNSALTSLRCKLLGYCFIICTYILLSNTKIFVLFKKVFSKIKKIKKLINSFDESKDSFSKLFKFKIISESLIWSIIAKIFQFIAVYLIFLSLDIDLGLILSGQIYYTSLVLGSLTFIPAGLIITESSMLALLLNVGVDLSTASLVVVFIRLITTWLGTLVGLFSLKSMGIR